MDSKTEEKILKVLLNKRDEFNNIAHPIAVLKDELPDVPEDVLTASLFALLEKKLITIHRPRRGLNSLPSGVTTYEDTLPLTQAEKLCYMNDNIVVSGKAIGYIRKIEEEKCKEFKKNLWEFIKWLFPTVISLISLGLSIYASFYK